VSVPQRDGHELKSFVVEFYLSSTSDGLEVQERAECAATDLRKEGTKVRYLRSIFIPEDEICFHLFEGPSAEAIGEASRRAAIDYDRILEAIDSEPAPPVRGDSGRLE
jgi:hypothetical protein